MTEDEVLEMLRGLPGAVVSTAGPGSGAPESAWGDSFATYDPDGDLPADQAFPFATVVVSDYPGFDTASDLDRPGVFRVNVGVGRRVFEEVVGHGPAAHAEHEGSYDHAAADVLLPHPVYAGQGWVCVVCPGPATEARLRELVAHAHAAAVARYRPRAEG